MTTQSSEKTNILIDRVENAENLSELAVILNEITESLEDDECSFKLDELVDLTNLPQFNTAEREWIDGSFSCDDTSDLFYNDCAGDVCGRVGWEVVDFDNDE